MKMPYNWKCPLCGLKTGTISAAYPPTCSNPTKHSAKTVDMELVSTNPKKDAVE